MAQGNRRPGIPDDRAPHELSPAAVEAIAQRTVELLAPLLEPAEASEWLTADEKASQLGIARSTVYTQAAQLHAVRIGTAIRFPRSTPAAAATPAPTGPAPRARPRRRSSGEPADLLPIRGRAA